MFFEKSVDTRSRAVMINFLSGHFKYDGCYANRVKIPHLSLTSAQQDAAYDLLAADENFWDLIGGIDNFTAAQNGHYTICTTGRSGGYLFLADSVYEQSGHNSYCRSCGQRNYKRVADPAVPGSPEAIVRDEVSRSRSAWRDHVYLEQPAIEALSITDEEKLALVRKVKQDLNDATDNNKCGRCGTEGEHGRVNFKTPPIHLSISRRHTGDDPDDMAEWSMSALRQRVRLIQEFDRACDDIREEFIELLDGCEVREETVLVSKTVRTIACRT